MHKMLLLAATLGAAVMIPASASAHGHGLAHSHVASPFGITIVLRDPPKVTRHHPVRHLRPQPWPRHFGHHAPRSSWHKPWRANARQVHRYPGGQRPWFRGPARPDFRDRTGRPDVHAPGRRWQGGHRAPHEGSKREPRRGRGDHR
jgi:hypothetical protein